MCCRWFYCLLWMYVCMCRRRFLLSPVHICMYVCPSCICQDAHQFFHTCTVFNIILMWRFYYILYTVYVCVVEDFHWLLCMYIFMCPSCMFTVTTVRQPQGGPAFVKFEIQRLVSLRSISGSTVICISPERIKNGSCLWVNLHIEVASLPLCNINFPQAYV